MKSLAAGLLAAGLAHQTAHSWLWRMGWLPEALRGHVWNITGALFSVLLLATIGKLARSVAVWCACAILIGHATQVGGCSVAYMVKPWPIADGDSLCSDGLAGPLAALGVAVTVLAVRRG